MFLNPFRYVILESGDPYWANVMSLLHLSGSSGSAVFTDSKGHAWTGAGGAQIATGHGDNGSALGLNGSSQYITTPSATAFNFGSGDFTLEASFKLTAYSASYVGSYAAAIIGKEGAAAEFHLIVTGTASAWTTIQLAGYNSSGVQTAATMAFPMSLNTNYHIRVVRSGNTAYFFNDGILIGTAAFNVVIRQAGEAVHIGSLNLASYRYFFPGYIWEVRISNVARSTSNYPLVTPFPDA